MIPTRQAELEVPLVADDAIEVDMPSSCSDTNVPSYVHENTTGTNLKRSRSVIIDASGSPRFQSSQTQSRSEFRATYEVHGNNPHSEIDSASVLEYFLASNRSFDDQFQFRNWLDDTTSFNLTVTERLEKSNWELDRPKTPPATAMARRLRQLSAIV